MRRVITSVVVAVVVAGATTSCAAEIMSVDEACSEWHDVMRNYPAGNRQEIAEYMVVKYEGLKDRTEGRMKQSFTELERVERRAVNGKATAQDLDASTSEWGKLTDICGLWQ